MQTRLSRRELANRRFRRGAYFGAVLGVSYSVIVAVLRVLASHKAVHSDNGDGPVRFLVGFYYAMSFPVGIAICIVCTVFGALLGGAFGIIVTKLGDGPRQ